MIAQVTLQTDVNKLCDLSMKFSQNHREQTSRIERMLQEYKEESKNLQDKNDELINQLNGINENWGCFFTRKKVIVSKQIKVLLRDNRKNNFICVYLSGEKCY